jgi:hypothetical protein
MLEFIELICVEIVIILLLTMLNHVCIEFIELLIKLTRVFTLEIKLLNVLILLIIDVNVDWVLFWNVSKLLTLTFKSINLLLVFVLKVS